MADEDRQGFEWDGTFYEWQVSTKGGDLILIDRLSGMGTTEFFGYIEADDTSRAPVLLGLIGTSLRARRPDWSLERIVRTVIALDLEELTMVGGDEETTDSPPAVAGDQPADHSEPPPPQSNGSAAQRSVTSLEIPDSSGRLGFPTGSRTTGATT